MPWWHGLTRNWAELDEHAHHPALRPLVVPLALREVMRVAAERIAALPRWRVVSVDADRGVLAATHATRLWRFVDDVELHFEPHPAGTRITGKSRSRIGRGDFGQNARNLREATAAIRLLS